MCAIGALYRAARARHPRRRTAGARGALSRLAAHMLTAMPAAARSACRLARVTQRRVSLSGRQRAPRRCDVACATAEEAGSDTPRSFAERARVLATRICDANTRVSSFPLNVDGGTGAGPASHAIWGGVCACIAMALLGYADVYAKVCARLQPRVTIDETQLIPRSTVNRLYTACHLCLARSVRSVYCSSHVRTRP